METENKFNIQQFLASMREMSRILLVGTGINMDHYPELAELEWRCILTTNRNDQISDIFSRPERQVHAISTIEEFTNASGSEKLNRSNPFLIFLNGRNSDDDDGNGSNSSAAKKRSFQRQFLRSIISLLKSTPRIELIIIGYTPEELDFGPFVDSSSQLEENQIKFFGTSEKIKSNTDINDLWNDRIVSLYAENLGEELKKTAIPEEDNLDDSDEEPVIYSNNNDDNNTVYINGKPVTLSTNLCNDFRRYGRILSIGEMRTIGITKMFQTEFFYKFLKLSPNKPQWYGYEKRNSFAVSRDFEKKLYETVANGLKTDCRKPIVLYGQSSSGKSIALAALAYRLFQEKTYPILYINNPNIPFTAPGNNNFTLKNNNFDNYSSKKDYDFDSPSFAALNNILMEITQKKGVAVVIVDWSIYNLQRNNTIYQLTYRLKNYGRNILFVVSAMTNPTSKKQNKRQNNTIDASYDTVEAPIKLTVKEKQSFNNLLKEKGKLPQNIIEKWMKNNEQEKGLLSMLYRLLFELHPQLEHGIKIEVTKAIEDVNEQIEKLDSIKKEQPHSEFAMQFAERYYKLYGCKPEDVDQSDTENIKVKFANNIQTFINGIAVSSLFKLRMPSSLAMHLIPKNIKNREEFLRILFSASCLYCVNDDDDYAQGEYYMTFRDPMDARIYLRSIEKEDKLLEIVSDVIAVMKNVMKNNNEQDTDSIEMFYNEEIQFLAQLLRMVGPNSDDPEIKNTWFEKYGNQCPKIIDTLEAFRMSQIEPQLILQEITYIREYYGNKKQEDMELKRKWLGKAIEIAQEVLHEDTSESHYWPQKTIDAITVESILSELRFEEFQKQTPIDYEKKSPNTFIIHSYAERSEMLQEVINAQPNNSYTYVALLKCFLFEYGIDSKEPKGNLSSTISNEKFHDLPKKMSEIIGIFDAVEAERIEDVEKEDHYIYYKASFWAFFDQITDNNQFNNYVENLIQKKNPEGVFLRIKFLCRKAQINYREGLNVSEEEKLNACENALKILNDNAEIVQEHAASQYARLQLTWLYYNRHPIFERERQYTKLSKEQWENLAQICEEFEQNILEKQPETISNISKTTVYYVMALAYAQQGRYEDSQKILKYKTSQNDFHSGRRQETWHIICDSQGNPKKFSGTFNRNLGERQILIKEIKLPIYYHNLQYIGKSDATGEAPDLCIGTSFRGFSAISLNWLNSKKEVIQNGKL